MIKDITGLHHVTSFASDPVANNRFFTQTMGLRRVKKTVNFDRPKVYHLYYGDEAGSAGTVMTYFPIPGFKARERGTGEVGVTRFSVPKGSLGYWKDRFSGENVIQIQAEARFGDIVHGFEGPDGDQFELVEAEEDQRAPWMSDVAEDYAVRGFHSAAMRLQSGDAMVELLKFMGYETADKSGKTVRMIRPDGNEANIIDVETHSGVGASTEGAGAVHHIAFSVPDEEAQLRVREALVDTGYKVTPVIDRDYFKAIYFRTPGGVLFEVATDGPGFPRDEPLDALGENLKLPRQHEHLREELNKILVPIN
ncbi:MAG: VOC family protein [Pseudomonadota bacterium]